MISSERSSRLDKTVHGTGKSWSKDVTFWEEISELESEGFLKL